MDDAAVLFPRRAPTAGEVRLCPLHLCLWQWCVSKGAFQKGGRVVRQLVTLVLTLVLFMGTFLIL